jgi:hypothetical protein
MAFDKLIDALNDFRGEYVRELTNSLTEKNLISSGQLGESIKLNVQPKVKLFGQIYRMQIRMAEYGENVDKGRAPGKGLPVGVLEEWLKYPNTLQKVTGQDKQLKTTSASLWRLLLTEASSRKESSRRTGFNQPLTR